MEEVIELVNEMSPYLLLGFLIAGLMHAFIPGSFYSKYLSGNSFRSVVNAAIFGVPLPLCSCGVIPTAMSLRREGASKGAVVSFLIATPQTGVDSIFATYSLMGLPFAIVRPIAALFTAVLGGTFVNSLENDKCLELSDERHLDASNLPTPSNPSNLPNPSILTKLKTALRFGFIEMMEDIGKWLVIGLIIAALITIFVPDSLFAVFKDNTLMSMLLVLCISIPMYLCATGSIPIAVALMMKGLTPGAALVLLMAGPASNAASILVINKVLGRKTLILYLISIITGAIAFGFGIDYLLPREWFTSSLIGSDACCHETPSIFQWGCTILLALLLLNIVRMKLMHKETCSCGHNHEDHCSCGHDHCHCSDEGSACSDEKHLDNDEEQESLSSLNSHLSSLTLTVKGMNCNHCRTNVEKAILSCSGVEEAKVDLQSSKAEVTGVELNEEEIIAAIESIGFSVSSSHSH